MIELTEAQARVLSDLVSTIEDLVPEEWDAITSLRAQLDPTLLEHSTHASGTTPTLTQQGISPCPWLKR